MTQQEETTLRDFEALVRGLMAAYRKEQQRTAQLSGELDACRGELSEAREECARLRKDYETLRAARILEASGAEVHDARAKLSKLIREVDKCIALIDI